MSRAKAQFPYAVQLMDGQTVVVLGRSPKGAIGYAEQVAGLVVNKKVRPAPLDQSKQAEAINRQEERG